LFLVHGALQVWRIFYEESLLRRTFPDYEATRNQQHAWFHSFGRPPQHAPSGQCPHIRRPVGQQASCGGRPLRNPRRLWLTAWTSASSLRSYYSGLGIVL
jgi:hypothetical protein